MKPSSKPSNLTSDLSQKTTSPSCGSKYVFSDYCANCQGDTIAPFIIPPLGPDYLEVWQSDPDVPFHGSPAPGPHPESNNSMARGSADLLRDEHLESTDV